MPSKLHWSQVRVLPRSKRVAQLGRAVRRFQKNSLFAMPPLEIFSGSLKQDVCYEHLANHQRHRFFDHDLSVLPKQPQPQTREAWRERTFPEAECRLIKEGCRYDISLSDGRTFRQAEILGTAQGKEAEFLFGYGNMLVLRLSDGRKAYVRQSCVRCMIESERPSESAASMKLKLSS